MKQEYGGLRMILTSDDDSMKVNMNMNVFFFLQDMLREGIMLICLLQLPVNCWMEVSLFNEGCNYVG